MGQVGCVDAKHNIALSLFITDETFLNTKSKLKGQWIKNKSSNSYSASQVIDAHTQSICYANFLAENNTAMKL